MGLQGSLAQTRTSSNNLFICGWIVQSGALRAGEDRPAGVLIWSLIRSTRAVSQVQQCTGVRDGAPVLHGEDQKWRFVRPLPVIKQGASLGDRLTTRWPLLAPPSAPHLPRQWA